MAHKVINRIYCHLVESNLVYPSHNEYRRVCKVDKEYVEELIHMLFGDKVHKISNKYVVEMNGRLYYNHDGNIWLIEPIKSQLYENN